jgi:hypothetical protein
MMPIAAVCAEYAHWLAGSGARVFPGRHGAPTCRSASAAAVWDI